VATVAAETPPQRESTAARILRALGKLPVHLVLIVVGLLWLVPTFGLFITSLMTSGDYDNIGWWKVLSKPSLATWDNYSQLLHHTDIPHALWTTVIIAVFGTILPIIIASAAGYAFAWLEFPGRDWIFIGVIAMLVVPLQMALDPDLLALQHARNLRHQAVSDPLPHRVRPAVRDLPAAQLLHRDTEGHPRVGADRRSVRVSDLHPPDPAARASGNRVARDLPVPVDVERPPRRADVRPQHTADHRRDLLEPAPVRLEHRPDRTCGLPLADHSARGVLRLPALLRRGAAGRLGEVIRVGIVGGGLAGFSAYQTLRRGGLSPDEIVVSTSRPDPAAVWARQARASGRRTCDPRVTDTACQRRSPARRARGAGRRMTPLLSSVPTGTT
jgi:hypothetical protein